MARTLLEHAAYELTRAGMTTNEDPLARKAAADTLALVKRFQNQEHTERTGRYVLEMFETLANFLPLTPITDDPDEWEKFEIDRKNVDTGEVEKRVVWQSKRASAIFSEDQGKTFIDQRTGKTGESVDHTKEAAEKAAAEADRKSRKDAAKTLAGMPAAGPVEGTPADEAPVAAPTEETVLAKQFPKKKSSKKNK